MTNRHISLGWAVLEKTKQDPFRHVVPINDTREHECTAYNCWCCPVNEDGVIVHNSEDQREHYERGERKLS